MEPLTTDSLRLDPLTRADYPWLCALYADPEIMRHIGSGVRTEEAARKNLDWLGEHGERLGVGYLGLGERQSGEPLGGALLVVRKEGAPVELGFLLARNAWGRGLATEAARALLDHA